MSWKIQTNKILDKMFNSPIEDIIQVKTKSMIGTKMIIVKEMDIQVVSMHKITKETILSSSRISKPSI